MSALVAIAVAASVSSIASAQDRDARVLVAEANQAFADGDYQTALEAYRAAEVALPESPELAYNQGVVHYKLGDYAAAHAAFGRALLTHDLRLEAKLKFNLGNVTYASALQERSNLPKAIDLLKTSIGYYRDAIEVDPGDKDARINIEIAYMLLKDLLDKLKRSQEKQQQRRDDQRDQQGAEQDQQQGSAVGEQQQPDTQAEQGQQRQQTDKRMTQEEGERLLQAVRDKERQRCKQLAKRRRAQQAPALKDW